MLDPVTDIRDSEDSYRIWGASLVAQMVKYPPAMWDTWVRSLGWEDSSEEGMAIYSSTLAWTEEPGGLQSIGLQKVGHDGPLSDRHT